MKIESTSKNLHPAQWGSNSKTYKLKARTYIVIYSSSVIQSSYCKLSMFSPIPHKAKRESILKWKSVKQTSHSAPPFHLITIHQQRGTRKKERKRNSSHLISSIQWISVGPLDLKISVNSYLMNIFRITWNIRENNKNWFHSGW